MLKAAEDLNFEEAAKIRDEIKRLNETSLIFSENPMAKP
jgi:excinuclease ABC subunit B